MCTHYDYIHVLLYNIILYYKFYKHHTHQIYATQKHLSALSLIETRAGRCTQQYAGPPSGLPRAGFTMSR
jgi:hypothetical protein